MKEARYAINGFMPPEAPNYSTRLIDTMEDGYLMLLVHCGEVTDIVHYAITTPGCHGTIKDPTYPFLPDRSTKCDTAMKQLLSRRDYLPEQCQVPIVISEDGYPEPLNANAALLTNPAYNIITIPAGLLPVGDSILEVVVNGMLVKYILNRPAYNIHAFNYNADAVVLAQKDPNKVKIYVREGESSTAYIDLGPAWDEKEFSVSMSVGAPIPVWVPHSVEDTDRGGKVLALILPEHLMAGEYDLLIEEFVVGGVSEEFMTGTVTYMPE